MLVLEHRSKCQHRSENSVRRSTLLHDALALVKDLGEGQGRILVPRLADLETSGKKHARSLSDHRLSSVMPTRG